VLDERHHRLLGHRITPRAVGTGAIMMASRLFRPGMTICRMNMLPQMA
jgi:hypothetical protein